MEEPEKGQLWNQVQSLIQLDQKDQRMSLLKAWILSMLCVWVKSSPIPMMVNGHLLSTENLDQSEHQIIFKNIGSYATEVEYHHIRIPVDLQAVQLTADQAWSIIQN